MARILRPTGAQRRRPTTKKNRALYQTAPSASSVLTLTSVAAMNRFAATLVRRASNNVWLLRGPLGSGKTTLVRGALRSLGYRGAVTSPTFTLVRHYRLVRGRWKRLVHIDAYRLRGQHEEAALDIQTAITDPSCLLCIEWPERLRSRYAWRPLVLRFSHTKTGRRVVWRSSRR